MHHGKGLCMVGFVLYIENMATVDAANYWSRFRQDNQNNKKYSSCEDQQNNGMTVKDIEQQELFCTPKKSIEKKALLKDCDYDFSHCLGAEQIQKFCSGATATSTKRMNKGNNKMLEVRGGDLGSTASAVGQEVIKKTPYNISLNTWKISFQVLLTTINVVFWLVPLKHKKFSENKLGLSLANAFSGGVFLSLAFGHFLPECVHGFEGYNEALPFMIALGGYLLIFFVEKVAFDTHSLLDCDHDSSKSGNEDKSSLGNGRGAIILLGALAVHSILEMTALGLANSFSDAAILTLSIALHQVRILKCIHVIAPQKNFPRFFHHVHSYYSVSDSF